MLSYCDPRNPFAALFIQTGRRDDEPAFVKLVSHKPRRGTLVYSALQGGLVGSGWLASSYLTTLGEHLSLLGSRAFNAVMRL